MHLGDVYWVPVCRNLGFAPPGGPISPYFEGVPCHQQINRKPLKSPQTQTRALQTTTTITNYKSYISLYYTWNKNIFQIETQATININVNLNQNLFFIFDDKKHP